MLHPENMKLERGARTPWGYADCVFEVLQGVYWVTTPEHGGLAVHLEVAMAKMNPKAIDAGIPFGQFFWYEEDCNWAVACQALNIYRQLSEEVFAESPEQLRDVVDTILAELS